MYLAIETKLHMACACNLIAVACCRRKLLRELFSQGTVYTCLNPPDYIPTERIVLNHKKILQILTDLDCSFFKNEKECHKKDRPGPSLLCMDVIS